jgi:hypothetical protein
LQVEEPVLRIMERTTDVGAVIVVQGEIDIATVDALRARLDACEGDATIDLRRVEFVDCLGSQPVGEGRETAPHGRLPPLCHVRHEGRKLRAMNPSLMQHATSAAIHTDRLRRARKGRRS